MMRLPVCLLALPLLMGCSYHVDTPLARVLHGPAHGAAVDPLAAAPIKCSGGACDPRYAAAIANATRMALEFRGHNIVDSELINAEARRRTTKSTSEATGDDKLATGVPFLELPEPAQLELLASIGVKGKLFVDLDIGLPHGADRAQTVRVSIHVLRLSDNDLVWRSHCSVETGNQHAVNQAIDVATHCALESEALW